MDASFWIVILAPPIIISIFLVNSVFLIPINLVLLFSAFTFRNTRCFSTFLEYLCCMCCADKTTVQPRISEPYDLSSSSDAISNDSEITDLPNLSLQTGGIYEPPPPSYQDLFGESENAYDVPPSYRSTANL